VTISSKPPVILCVDDEELPLKLRQEVLSRQGYRVLAAHNGASALRMFKDNKIDLVISDNRLPDLSGIEITAEMKRLLPGAHHDALGIARTASWRASGCVHHKGHIHRSLPRRRRQSAERPSTRRLN